MIATTLNAPEQTLNLTQATLTPVTIPTGPAFRPVVNGQAIVAGPTEQAAGLRSGKDVSRGADGVFKAKADGNVRLTQGEVSVEPLMKIGAAPVTQAIDFDGDVAAEQGLFCDAEFRCTGDLFVPGPVEASELRVCRSLLAHGDITRRRTGRVNVGNDLICANITSLELVVRGAIRITGDITNSQVACGGQLTAAGQIVGGRVQSNAGLTCGTLGNDARTPTVIELGDARSHALLIAELKRSLERRRAQVTQFRAKVSPFISELKRLSPAQREKATELLAHLAEIEEQLENETTYFNESKRLLTEKASTDLVVSGTAHPGVLIRLGGLVECVSREPITGPFRIRLNRGSTPCAVELLRAGESKPTVLPSRAIGTSGDLVN